MMKNSVWTHDAHCDNLYMRVLLGDGKLNFPSTGNKHFQLQVTFPRLQEGNVHSILLKTGSEKISDSTGKFCGVAKAVYENTD